MFVLPRSSPAETSVVFYAMIGLALLIGVFMVLPIGGADMPVVISLLNSYAGLASAATGFAIGNNVLIICGALDGASGFLLSIADEQGDEPLVRATCSSARSAARARRVAATPAPGTRRALDLAPRTPRCSWRYAQLVIVVPGYGMAVAQAQHQVRELAELIEKRGGEVKYAIHPVAGRMPGHMNVLLAEANVPYDQLYDMDEINGEFEQRRRGARHRRERRGEPGGAQRHVEPDLRHADPQRGPGAERHRAQARA